MRGEPQYAAGEDIPHTTTIPFADKRVLVRVIDASQPPDTVLLQIARLASQIRSVTRPRLSTVPATSMLPSYSTYP
jgi:hypothetical protein